MSVTGLKDCIRLSKQAATAIDSIVHLDDLMRKFVRWVFPVKLVLIERYQTFLNGSPLSEQHLIYRESPHFDAAYFYCAKRATALMNGVPQLKRFLEIFFGIVIPWLN